MAEATIDAVLHLRGIGREHGDEDDVFYDAYWEAWSEARDVLRERTYVHSNATYRFELDWSTMATVVRRQSKYTAAEWLELSEVDREAALKFPRNARVPIRVYCTGTGESSNSWMRLLRLLLSETFLAVNLAAPSAFSVDRMIVVTSDGFREDFPLRLGGLFFEEAWITALRNDWPTIEYVPLRKVWKWLIDLDLGTTQIATDRISRALFSVLHACQMPPDDPGTLMWLAQCVESLFDVPTALSKNLVWSRSAALFGNPSREKHMRKALAQFYEHRNKFAHGGADIVHPLRDWGLDEPALEGYMFNWIQPTFFASTLVIAALQLHAMNGWREVAWSETPAPQPVTASGA